MAMNGAVVEVPAAAEESVMLWRQLLVNSLQHELRQVLAPLPVMLVTQWSHMPIATDGNRWHYIHCNMRLGVEERGAICS